MKMMLMDVVLLSCNNRQELSKEDLERVIEACDMVRLVCSFLSLL